MYDYDKILKHVGEFKRFQIFAFTIGCAYWCVTGIIVLSIIFQGKEKIIVKFKLI